MRLISYGLTTCSPLMMTVLFCIVLFSSSAGAGDRDTHLTATHFLARHAGLSDEEAKIIASANWSMDRNTSTIATPTGFPIQVGPLGRDAADPPPVVKWFQRGQAEHSLGKPNVAAAIQPDLAAALGLWKPDTQAAVAQLSALKSDVEVAIRNGDRMSAD